MNGLIYTFLAIGAVFNALGSVALLRFPDVYTRIHGATKCTTFGSIFSILAVAVYGIVRFNPSLTTDAGRTFLANSITLTPGTLTLDIDETTGDFYVHWINVKDPSPTADDVCGPFPKWARRVAE